MEQSRSLLLAFYGDDFTGSTDALESMTRAGARTVLFLEPPDENELKKYGELDAIGIAGLTRTMEPEEMYKTLIPAFQQLRHLNPRHIHYKVCSTFDSSPEIGNIGVAIRCGFENFKNAFIPVLVAAPELGRYMAFGNLFARKAIGSKGEIFRLDKHPSMSRHPVTPAKAGDLRQHLALQADYKSGLIDLIDLQLPEKEVREKLEELKNEKHDVIFFDGVYEHQMKIIGRIIDQSVEEGKSLFSVGSSGVGKALGDYWQGENFLTEITEWKDLSESKPLLVLSGSMSPVTGGQIEYALKNGFEEVAVDPSFLYNGDSNVVLEYKERILKALKQGKSTILHTSRGPEDPRLSKVKAITASLGWDALQSRKELPKHFGRLLGRIAKGVLDEISLRRLVIAGGDTSSYVARELEITAVEMIAPLVKGAPLCLAFAAGSPIDGMEINLKGGQVGELTYFLDLQKGRVKQQ